MPREGGAGEGMWESVHTPSPLPSASPASPCQSPRLGPRATSGPRGGRAQHPRRTEQRRPASNVPRRSLPPVTPGSRWMNTRPPCPSDRTTLRPVSQHLPGPFRTEPRPPTATACSLASLPPPLPHQPFPQLQPNFPTPGSASGETRRDTGSPNDLPRVTGPSLVGQTWATGRL